MSEILSPQTVHKKIHHKNIKLAFLKNVFPKKKHTSVNIHAKLKKKFLNPWKHFS